MHSPRRFVPVYLDHFQSAACQLVAYTATEDRLTAHWGDGTRSASVYASVAELLAAGRTDYRERVREVRV